MFHWLRRIDDEKYARASITNWRRLKPKTNNPKTGTASAIPIAAFKNVPSTLHNFPVQSSFFIQSPPSKLHSSVLYSPNLLQYPSPINEGSSTLQFGYISLNSTQSPPSNPHASVL